MDRPDADIGALQNGETAINRRRAIVVAHRQSQRAQTASLVVSILLAAAGVAATLTRRSAGSIALAGTIWAVLYATVLVPWSARGLRQAAVLQEMFDVDLFGIPWNSVIAGDRIAEPDVNRLSARFRGPIERLRNYYVTSDRLSYLQNVFLCIEQNLSWGPRVRQRYANAVAALGIGWSAVGIAVAIPAGMTITELISSWLTPSLGLLLFCLDQYRAQTTNNARRHQALRVLHSASADAARPERLRLARQLQDATLEMRMHYPRVPEWFFRRFHNLDELDFIRAAGAREGPAHPPPAGAVGGTA
jgi:hypothetical protein